LKHAADATFDDRSRGQVMADTLLERVTGRPAEEPESVTLNLVMSDQALWGWRSAECAMWSSTSGISGQRLDEPPASAATVVAFMP
jgi:hypothetical protein